MPMWSRSWSRWGHLYNKIDRILYNQEKIMATLADITAADTAVKAELDKIAAGVMALVASNKDLAAQLATAIASADPAALQAALDLANSMVVEGQTVMDSLPKPTP